MTIFYVCICDYFDPTAITRAASNLDYQLYNQSIVHTYIPTSQKKAFHDSQPKFPYKGIIFARANEQKKERLSKRKKLIWVGSRKLITRNVFTSTRSSIHPYRTALFSPKAMHKLRPSIVLQITMMPAERERENRRVREFGLVDLSARSNLIRPESTDRLDRQSVQPSQTDLPALSRIPP